MTVEPHRAIQPLKCGKCATVWDTVIVLPMKLDAFVKVFTGFVEAGCPGCGEVRDVRMLPTRDLAGLTDERT